MKTFYLDKRRWRLGSLVSCLLLSSPFVYANDKSKVSDESVFSTKEYNYSIQQNKKKATRIVKGTVISGEDNLPIIGANVWVKNGTEGAITDIDGNYSIKVEGVAPVLTFSYVGMKSQDVAVGDKQVINVTLSPDSEQLDEVVIVGYGSQKKESVVGAISTVDVTNLKIP